MSEIKQVTVRISETVNGEPVEQEYSGEIVSEDNSCRNKERTIA